MKRKATDLDSLIRLRDWTVDEKRRELGILLARKDELRTLGVQMDRQLLREQKITEENPMTAGLVFAAFADNHRKRKEHLAKVMADLEIEIDAARENLAEAYRQVKVLEEVQKARRLKERIEENQREQIDLDEIAQTQFRRRH